MMKDTLTLVAFWAVAMALVFWLLMVAGFGREAPPISYGGRPPVGPIEAGKCWCQFHGPHGGCKKWVCRHKDLKELP
jgi:hypothetical protein